MTRLATGVPGFDGMVQGGLPLGSSVIIQGPPGQEKLQFALTFLAEGLKAGASGIVVISSQSPDSALAELRHLGVDLDAVTREGRLRIVDWYSWSEETVKDVEERGIVHRSSVDLTNLGVALSRAIAAVAKTESPRAVIEMLSPATNVYEVTQVYAFAQSAKKKFDRFGFTSLVLLEKEMHAGPEITTLHQPFDGVIEVERTRMGDRIVRKIGVLHLKDTAPDPTFRILEMTESGLRVVREPQPAAGAPPGRGSGTVLESQEERARRLTLIMQIAGERLKLDPRDADALFAMAAAQATLDDPRGGLASLERLAELDPSYPGLWVLKTKLHARLGETERARQSRLRADQAERMDATRMESTVPCPMCDAPVAADATLCANCGVKFAPATKLEDELEDLGNAAIQDMVSEELGEEASAPTPPKKADEARTPSPRKPEVPAPPKIPPKPQPKRGLTNGLVLSRGAGRRTGMTNGLKGRTNGLRGRTNGLTNGLGRTNGLTNGLGRTNGLTNGLGRTNGLTNGLGRTNGLTNGLGRTNGLTNGLGSRRPSGFRATGLRGMMQTAGWKLYVIPLVVVGLLLVPLFMVPEYKGGGSPIQIDGQFGDWAGVATEPMTLAGGLNPNVDVVRFGVVPNLGPVAFYVEVAGSALAGGGPAPGTMDSVRIFVDIDGSASTGYRIDGLGADRMIEISGYNGAVLSSTLWEFDSNRNPRDWNGWIKGTATPAAASGSRIETEAAWLPGVPSSVPAIATVHTESWDGRADVGDFPISPGIGTLSVVSDPQLPDVLTGTSVPLLRLGLTAHGQPVTINSLQVEIAGTAPASAAASLRLMDGSGVLAQATPSSRTVSFAVPPTQVSVDTTTTWTVVGDFASTTGETFGLRLPSAHPFGVGAAVVALRENPGPRTLGYLGVVPLTPRVDGAFDEWTALRSDPSNDVAPQPNADIDLGRYGAQRGGPSTFLYADVSGRLFHGTSVPEKPRQSPQSGSQGPADTDRDGVPDALDPFPLDFNNDGIPDAQTNGDYDKDGVTDYGFPGGTDYWLNTTIPNNFPAPYAGRSVSVYIGPTENPPVLGEDVLRIFLDIDNSTFSGYSIGGIGADRLVEIRGKDNAVTQTAYLGFSGSFPGQWAWTPLSPVTVALGYHAVELSVVANASQMYVEASDFWGDVDSSVVAPAFASAISSFKVSSADTTLSLPWQQVGPQPSATVIDPGANAATTIYNHQRKVVRAGDTPGTACDATNSDGCWYVVFYDQFSEAVSTVDSRLPTANSNTTNNCGGTDSGDWSTPNNAHSDTDAQASATAAPAKNKISCTKWKTFGFNIPASASITAVKVQFNYNQGGTDTTYSLNVGPRGQASGTAFVCPVQTENTHTSTFATYLFDFTSACSGHTWGPADFNNDGIEVDIGASRGSTNTGQTMSLDWLKVQVTYTPSLWDRVILMRSLDTSGSTWGAQIILASGRSGDSPLLYGYDSTEPSIAMDSAGFLHVVWVSAAATGNQGTMNLVRYVKTTVAYPTQSQLASTANWQAVTVVDDANPGYMPTVSTDSLNNPHIAWSGSKTSGTAFYKNKAAGTWRSTVSWGSTYTGISVDVSPQTNYVAVVDSFDTASVAAIAYRSNTGTNTVNSPKTRTWDGSAWGAESEQSTAGSPIRVVRMAWSPIDANTRIIVTESDDGWLDAYVCTPTCTVTNNIGQVWTTAPTTAQARFDIAYEGLSGKALLVYHKEGGSSTQDIAYKTYSGGSWSAEQYIDDGVGAHNVYSVIKLASKKGSNQIGMVGGDLTNTRVNAWIWDGTAWGNFIGIATTGVGPLDRDNADLAWESSSGNLLAVAASNTTSIVSKEYTTSWSAASTFACAISATIRYTRLKANPLSTANDAILGVVEDPNFYLSTCYWTGSAWANLNTHAITAQVNYRSWDFAWEPTNSKGLLVYSANVGPNWIGYRTFTAPNTWGTATTLAMGASDHTWIQARTNPFSGTTKILGAASENTAQSIGAFKWDGSAFTVIGTTTITAGTGGFMDNEMFDLKFREPGAGGSEEIRHMVCKDLSTSNCDTAAKFTKFDGTAGFDTVATGVETGSYPSVATTYAATGDLWIAYAKDVDTTTRAIYARFLSYPSSGFATAEVVDSLSGTQFSRPTIGVDKDGNVYALYVALSGPQLYTKSRIGGTWGTRTAIDTMTDYPSLVVRAPNDPLYGTAVGALYWKSSTSETYFYYIPEFGSTLAPIFGSVVLILFLWRRARRKTPSRISRDGHDEP